jgi:hypothetical protein
MTTKQTQDYDQFIFREDNRQKIDDNHVLRLIESIQAKNLLQYRPIIVNERMEVIDGQHRLLAAKKLAVTIYYQINRSLESKDIILMNIAKSWGMGDYLNFYCKNGNKNYIQLKEFMNESKLTLNIAINIMMPRVNAKYREFKEGKYIHDTEKVNKNFSLCWKTIEIMRKASGYCPYLYTARFWQALVRLVDHEDFDAGKWLSNLEKLSEKITQKVTVKEYLLCLLDVYNWRNNAKINFWQKDFEEFHK